MLRAIAAIGLANLPLRRWGRFDEEYPLYRMAWVSGFVNMCAGVAIGVPGYLAFVGGVASDVNRALIRAQSDLVQIPGWGVLALPIFLFTTTTGLASLYLTLSGFLRAAGAYLADDARGDFLLTWIDNVARRTRAKQRHKHEAAERLRMEGAAVSDRLVTGASLGRPEIELAIVAARERDWPRNAYLVGSDGRAFRIGARFDMTFPAGLRAVYPLEELRTLEAIRHAIAYDLPPLRDR